MKSFEQKVKQLQKQICELENNEALKEERKIPSDCYFLTNDKYDEKAKTQSIYFTNEELNGKDILIQVIDAM